jgi:hypothetical protein
MKMKKSTKILIAAVTVALLCGTSWVLADEKIAKQTDQRCTVCHDKPGSKLLTDKGLYFETTGSLEGFDELATSFGKCTSCHVRKPGSTKLTGEGKKMAELVDSMSELKEWVEEKHPAPAEKEAEKEEESEE